MAKTQSNSSLWDTHVRVSFEGCHSSPGMLTSVTGYLACFLGALQMVAGQKGKSEAAKNAVIHAKVHIGNPSDLPGFGLEVELKVEGIEDQALIDAAHEVTTTPSPSFTYMMANNVTFRVARIVVL